MRNYIIIPNQRNVNVKITRGELVRLLIACTSMSRESESWKALHDKLKEQLDEHDRIYKEEYKI